MIVSAVIVGISLIFTFVNYQNYSAKVENNPALIKATH